MNWKRKTNWEKDARRYAQNAAFWQRRNTKSQEAIDRALHELGVPGEGYPAPVANAVRILRSAADSSTKNLTAPRGEG